ncbi:MAG: VWA domain-containing protein [Paludibacteraceae bacterium]|nr:VWA domain-containing protein [Paludibacteraceae bacterium]HOU68465.1 VWA domain-containing protein [Paludibacteraceae bacterium]HQF50317.1 VWA domain-containing protein [Paludibacteraceae bacterium]
MFRFANQEYLFLLLIIPICILWFIFCRYRRRSYLKKLGDVSLLKNLMPSVSTGRAIFKFIFLMLAYVCVVMAMARPQIGSKRETATRKGIEVVVALDISNSMLAEDLQPNRMERAKQMISRMVDNLNNDKMGLVLFAGKSYIQVPMTSDYRSIKSFLSSVNPSLIPQQGTAISEAIAMASRTFSKDEKVGRSIIIITDGENHEDNSQELEAAKQANKDGIQVNVVGMGSPEGALILLENGDYKKDKSGAPVTTKLDEGRAQSIAEAGNGVYVRADNTNGAVKVLSKELDKIAAGDVSVELYSEYNEQFQIFLWIALVLLLLEFCVLEKKNRLFTNIKLFE